MRGMFLAAVMGDSEIVGGRLGDFRPFEPPTFKPDGSVDKYNDWELDPINPGWPEMGKRREGAVFFFDASDPDRLTESLQAAFRAAIAKGSNNATSSPSLPMIGASLGGQVYMGSFAVPDGGGVLWTGDLRMFGITEDEHGLIQILDRFGNVTAHMDANSAVWSASEELNKKPWYQRTLYTRLPNTADPIDPANSPALPKKFTDRGDDFTGSTTGLINFIGNKEKAKRAVQHAAGGDTILGTIGADDRPISNRKTIMGDIVNSSPAAVEYEWSSVESKLSGTLKNISGDTNAKKRFRLILVGTNQGWLHAFGEVSVTATVKDSGGRSREMVKGNVEELWAFMPSDFLEELDYISKGGNAHRFMVDGKPAIYHLDVPPTSGGIGDGIVEAGERVLAIFGLGKGGRSYYALNIEDPFTPKIQWTLIPDEADKFPSTRIETNSGTTIEAVRNMIKNFGFSTATPAFGRIEFESGGRRHLKDAVFLSGGFSVPEVDEKFGAKLGRSVIALDAYTGKVLAAKDLGAEYSNIGPIGTGLIPFEFILNSGAAQRAYFTDYNGGLWAWGSTDTDNGSNSLFRDFRKDTSVIQNWDLRKVYQDGNASEVRSNRYTTSPAPFRVANFPGHPKEGSARPVAAAIAMVSGDRNNPLDYYYTAQDKPVNHKLTVIFDRQDSEAWKNANGVINGTITDNGLADFTRNIVTGTPENYCEDSIFKLVTPNCKDFYLAPASGDPKFGYYINFQGNTGGFFPKGINSPTVVSGSLFYTVFSPEAADPCLGGVGLSRSWVIADVVNPLKEDNRSEGAAFYSGMVNTWGGVASDYIQMGTRGVIQGGTPANAEDGTSLQIRPSAVDPSEGFPKPRVWRVTRQ
jgi:hypothetical protein